jgi:hypothetical protein
VVAIASHRSVRKQLDAVQREIDDRVVGSPQVSQNGWLLSRRGRSLPANAGDFDTHRDPISSRFDCRRSCC